MKTLKLLAICLLGLGVLGGAIANTAEGKAKALALYDEGKPAPDGSTLTVEIHGFCPSSREEPPPAVWRFTAHLTHNHASPVVMSVDPGRQRCESVYGLYNYYSTAELSEIQLEAQHKLSVVGVFTFHPGCPTSSGCGHCIWESHNGKGNVSIPPAEAMISALIYAKGTTLRECEEPRPGGIKITGVLRDSHGTVLEVRRV
jgi:hypothetical protein